MENNTKLTSVLRPPRSLTRPWYLPMPASLRGRGQARWPPSLRARSGRGLAGSLRQPGIPPAWRAAPAERAAGPRRRHELPRPYRPVRA